MKILDIVDRCVQIVAVRTLVGLLGSFGTLALDGLRDGAGSVPNAGQSPFTKSGGVSWNNKAHLMVSIVGGFECRVDLWEEVV